MSSHSLISLSIGPVQDFIASALRTRDLWFGSHMLSEVSKAAARALHDAGATMIFPSVASGKELEPDTSLNVANRVIASLQGDVHRAIEDARHAAGTRLQGFIEYARGEFGRRVRPATLRQPQWDLQNDIADLLEIYAVAVAWDGQDYVGARERLDRLTNARKNTRCFSQPLFDADDARGRLPKSSLDGRRETVLPKDLSRLARRKLRMSDNEQLDLMGVVKRLAGKDPDQFTPTTRIACDEWVQRVWLANDQAFTPIIPLLSRLVDAGLVTRVKGNAGIYDALPFDASLVYPDRLNTMIADCQSGKLDTGLGKTLEELRTLLRPIWKHHSVPDPYYALMLADGDRMGELLGNARSEGEHRAISSRLAHFAQEVPGRVRKYRGHCIYAGGDDVLAMVSLSQAIELADDLRGFFSHELGDIAKQLGAPMPTFSVGLVFAHMQSPLGLTRRLASRAEQLAKGDESDNPRNALGILVAPRSGAPVELRTIWGDDVNAPYRQILELIGSYADNELPSGFAYEVRTLANMLEGSEPADAQRIAQLELKRLLSHKNRDQGSRPVTLQTIRSVLEQAHDLPLEQVVQAHIVSRWIGQHLEECP